VSPQSPVVWLLHEVHYWAVWVCAEARTVLRAVAADFFFGCWCVEIPLDNRSARTKVRPLSCAKLSFGSTASRTSNRTSAKAVPCGYAEITRDPPSRRTGTDLAVRGKSIVRHGSAWRTVYFLRRLLFVVCHVEWNRHEARLWECQGETSRNLLCSLCRFHFLMCAMGHAVALIEAAAGDYKPEGRRFDSPWSQLILLPTQLWH
jgi:hypothetical protein